MNIKLLIEQLETISKEYDGEIDVHMKIDMSDQYGSIHMTRPVRRVITLHSPESKPTVAIKC